MLKVKALLLLKISSTTHQAFKVFYITHRETTSFSYPIDFTETHQLPM